MNKFPFYATAMTGVWIFGLLSIGCGQESGRAPATSRTTAPILNSGEASVASSSPPANRDRKIVFSAELEVVVDDFGVAEREIRSLIQSSGGFISAANLQSLQGARRYGSLNAKVPSEQFESFVESVGKIGVLVSKQQKAQDMTEEFVDLSARMENKKKMEQRILELIDRSNDSLDQVLKLESELSRVREEVERMEGKIRLISEQTVLSSVDIQIREEQEYTPAEPPAFSVRISNAWDEALKSFLETLEAIAIFVVSYLFALIFAGVAILLSWWALAWIRRSIEVQRTHDALQISEE